MGVQADGLLWERQPGEEEDAYAAFLTYRDLGPCRTPEWTRKRLGRRPSDLHEIQEWSGRWDWRERAVAWDEHLQVERERADAEFMALWERRRLQALEDGWKTCQALRAKLGRMMGPAPELPTPPVAPREPAPPTPEAPPEAVATPGVAEESAAPEPSREDCLAMMRLAKLVVELEWALINEAFPAPGKFDPWKATAEELQAYLVLNPQFKPRPMRC